MHTKGPWVATADPYPDGTPYFRFEGGNSGYGDLDGGFNFTAIISDDDARLIAAAPDLLEALKSIAEFPMPGQDNMIAANMREVARRAIAKATKGT